MRVTYDNICTIIEKETGFKVNKEFRGDLDECHVKMSFNIGESLETIMGKHAKTDKFDFTELQSKIKDEHFELFKIIVEHSDTDNCSLLGVKFIEECLGKTQLNSLEIRTFILLHEYGHAYDMYENYKGRYYDNILEIMYFNRQTDKIKGSEEEKFRHHRNIRGERFADKFAISLFNTIYDSIIGSYGSDIDFYNAKIITTI